MTINTSYQGSMDKCARAVGVAMPISKKVSYEISNYARGRDPQKVINFLEEVMKLKAAVPYKRFNMDVGHKPGKMAAGRYPVKASSYFVKLLKSVIANAKDKGLDVNSLKIIHVNANKGPDQWHHGRQRRRKMKSTHVEIIVESLPEKKIVEKKVVS